ncbi:MAG: HypC/HybG/HupF family hydrogenase formation chaperone [Polyangiaceae bacterium]
MCLGIPGLVVEIQDAERLLGVVDVSGVRRTVNLACVVDDRPVSECVGEWVLIHVGFAMSRIDASEAARTLELLAEVQDIERDVP